VKFLLDECLSHKYTKRLAGRGYPDAIHPIHVGMRGARDDEIVARALTDDRIIISANARDFRKLLATTSVHPGAVLVQVIDIAATWTQIIFALSFIEMHAKPADYMTSRVVEVSAEDGVRPYVLPEHQS
jgi:predicted nuclease of predicted toxin-antitoxin system